ncbi:MAG: hypothetical protein WB711_07725 [Terriglobales bacterium]
MSADPDKSLSAPGPSCVLASRDYADIAHLSNPSVIERILSKTRAEATTYVGALLQSGVSSYVLAGPKVALSAMIIEALTDLCREVSALRKAGTIPEDFSGRPSGYQTWVELLSEIDSNPVDAERLKAMKAMFLAANRVNATDGESLLAYQLFQVAKGLSSGQLLLLRTVYGNYLSYLGGPRTGGSISTREWQAMLAKNLGHGLSALIGLDERKLVERGLIAPWTNREEHMVPLMDGRMTDLGIKFCENIGNYQTESAGS